MRKNCFQKHTIWITNYVSRTLNLNSDFVKKMNFEYFPLHKSRLPNFLVYEGFDGIPSFFIYCVWLFCRVSQLKANVDKGISKSAMEMHFLVRIYISWICSFSAFLVFTFLENYFCLLGVRVFWTKCFEQGEFLMEYRGKTKNKKQQQQQQQQKNKLLVFNVKEYNLFIAIESQI